MATEFNWTPQILIDYPDSSYTYVSPAGNDSNPGTAIAPKASILNNTKCVLASGIYIFTGSLSETIGDGSVIINVDISASVVGTVRNIKILGINLDVASRHYDVFFLNTTGDTGGYLAENCIYKNFISTNRLVPATSPGFNNNTFAYSHVLLSGTFYGQVDYSIWYESDLQITQPLYITNSFKNTCIGINTRLKLLGESSYTAASGATSVDRINDLKARAVIAFGGAASDYFISCISEDPLFVDPDNDNFHLQPNSPCRYASTNGRYIGAKGVAHYTATPDPTEGSTIYNNSSAINLDLTVAGKYTIIDSTSVASIETEEIDFGSIKDIANISLFKDINQGDRFAGLLDSTAKLGTIINPGTGVLLVASLYYVTQDTIINDGIEYFAGDSFIATSVDYTTTTSGTVRLILEVNSRESILLKAFQGAVEHPWINIENFNKPKRNTNTNDADGTTTLGNGDVGYDQVNVLPIYPDKIKVKIVYSPNGI
jgi:hypothetical protein